MRHIVSFSGGKDSTAMLFKMLEKGMQVDEVVFFDFGVEFPEMITHVEKVRSMIDVPFTAIKPDCDFEYWMTKHVKIRGDHKGEVGYGWPDMGRRWCTKIKTDSIDRGRRRDYSYQGIAADESHRMQDDEQNRYPLIEWGMTEKDCLEYCYSLGFRWGGLYEKRRRVSCYLCPLQSLPELKMLWRDYPELWSNMKRLDALSNRKFRPDYTLKELEDRFEAEKAQCVMAL